MKKIYFDGSSSTRVDNEVIKAMKPYFETIYGNPSSIHTYGRESKDAVEKSREKVSSIISSKPDEIVFTSGGTESDNLAIKGISYLNKDKIKKDGYHIVTSSIEHPAVLETCNYLEKQGFNVKYLCVDKYGLINIDELLESITKNTFLFSIMFANNEIGTIEPMEEIGKIAKENDILFHTDAVQAIGKEKIDINKLKIDLLSVSSHKIYGPKGVGALYVKNGVNVEPLMHGGGHENGKRSGTYNTPGIVGLGKACEVAEKNFEKDNSRLKNLRDKIINDTLEIEGSYLNGHPQKRLVNNAHFRFDAVEGESLLMLMDEKGIAVATGSACSSTKLAASHVLLAIGLKPEEAHGSVRISLCKDNNSDEVKIVLKELKTAIEKLRKISPLWNK